MNRFNKLLLGSTALTFVAFGSAAAAPVVFTETTDFALSPLGVPTALSLPVSSGGSPGPFAGVEVFGTVGGFVTAGDASGTTYDGFDHFSITGLTPGQLLNIQLVPNSGGSGGASSGGPDPSGADSSGADSSGPGLGGGGTLSGFALNLMEYTGGATSSGADSSGATSSGPASSGSAPTLTQIGASIFQASFDFNAFVPTAGEMIFQIESGVSSPQGYRLILTSASTETAVPEPGSAAGLAAGAAGLGFLAARRRRRKS